MLALLLYSIICLTHTFKDIYKITPKIVTAEIDFYTTDVIFENVTILGDEAFFSRDQLKSILFSSSIESIKTRAFFNCKNLENISFKEESSLTTIGDSAFEQCYELKSISIPSSVKSIGTWGIC